MSFRRSALYIPPDTLTHLSRPSPPVSSLKRYSIRSSIPATNVMKSSLCTASSECHAIVLSPSSNFSVKKNGALAIFISCSFHFFLMGQHPKWNIYPVHDFCSNDSKTGQIIPFANHRPFQDLELPQNDDQPSTRISHPVYQACRASRAEAVIDIDDRHPRRRRS